MSEIQEYIDEQTGIRMTIETAEPYDIEHPRITVFPPAEPNTLTWEELESAVHRLKQMANLESNNYEH